MMDEKRKYEAGQVFKFDGMDGVEYWMLVWTHDMNWTLIDMRNGRRWVEPSLIKDASRKNGLTEEQLRGYVMGHHFWGRFTPVRVSIMEVK